MKTIICILFAILSLQALCQPSNIPVDVSVNGGKYNVAVISELFLNLYGEEQVERWLQNRTILRFHFDVDSLGCALRVKLLPSGKFILSEEQEAALHSFINEKHVYFHFWYDDDPECGTTEMNRERARQEIRRQVEDKGYKTIYVLFNQELVEDYLYSKKYPTYVSYLKFKIKYYKSEKHKH